jgi:hypothetical protein
LLLELLEQQKRILGMEHPDMIIAAANLASTIIPKDDGVRQRSCCWKC